MSFCDRNDDHRAVGGQADDRVLKGKPYQVLRVFCCEPPETGLGRHAPELGILPRSAVLRSRAAALAASNGVSESELGRTGNIRQRTV